MRPFLLFLASLALLVMAAPVRGADTPAASRTTTTPMLLDRIVVRWYAPETGGASHPQFIFERELAFEARIEALADPDAEPGPYSDRHVRAALDRHIAETLLGSLPIAPAPTPKEVAQQAEAARKMLQERTRGQARLIAAAATEGLGSDELDALFRRQARASLYLDRMVAPMLEPSEFELRAILRSSATPFKDRTHDEFALLKREYVGQRLAQALEAYYQNARSRVTVTIVLSR